ncbi:hypothetical protein ACG7TL_008995 [Trametes sanguinea]
MAFQTSSSASTTSTSSSSQTPASGSMSMPPNLDGNSSLPFSFLITFIAVFLFFLGCGLGSRRVTRQLRRNLGLQIAQSPSPSTSRINEKPLLWDVFLSDPPSRPKSEGATDRYAWENLSPLSATYVRTSSGERNGGSRLAAEPPPHPRWGTTAFLAPGRGFMRSLATTPSLARPPPFQHPDTPIRPRTTPRIPEMRWRGHRLPDFIARPLLPPPEPEEVHGSWDTVELGSKSPVRGLEVAVVISMPSVDRAKSRKRSETYASGSPNSSKMMVDAEVEEFEMVVSHSIISGFYAAFISAKLALAAGSHIDVRASDPCAAIANQTWAAPSDVRACFSSFPVNQTIKENIVEVINKTLAFHTSVNYEKRAPEPFTADVHEDVLADLARISGQTYANELDLHVDLSRTLKRLNDGHCVYINQCFDSLFLTFLPTPLVLLTDAAGNQSVHIAPEAFDVATAEFGTEVTVWQDALPGGLKGQLASLSGAQVLEINGQDPFVAVNANAEITGGFQGLGSRQNSFFSSYQSGATGWTYIMGNFAQQSLPLVDSVTLAIRRVNSSTTDTVTLPYRSRIASTAIPWTDAQSFHDNNCVAIPGTNGVDLYGTLERRRSLPANPANKFRQAPVPETSNVAKELLDVMLDTVPLQDVVLPPGLTPKNPLVGSTGVVQFFMLDDKKTGVLALGSFSAGSVETLNTALLTGLQNLKKQGATQLIVDVSNNGGGFICVAHWLHRIIAGPKPTTEPNAGLDTEARAGPLAQLIVEQIIAGADPDNLLMYNPLQWRFANNTPFAADFDWLDPPVAVVVNGIPDAFSQRLGDECEPYPTNPPSKALFDPKKVAIVTMAKEEGAKTVVYGGKEDVQQQYCGTVGGQSTDYSTIDTQVKTTHLKNNTLAPPDFLSNSVQGLTWRLGFGIQDPSQPEEPIVVSDEEDATLVENELNRWNESPSSSIYEYSPTHEVVTPSLTHVPPQPGLHKSLHLSNQKRKRQDPEAPKARSPPRSAPTSLAARGCEVSDRSGTRSGSRTKASGRSVSSALDDSLRRLEALSASLLAMSATAPVPLTAPKATAQPPADPDKRQIGKHDDEGSFSSFDLLASTLLPPLNPGLPSPRPFRTIVLAHLPKKFRVRTFVESWAKRFGTAVRTEIDSRAGKALIEYARPSDAEAAFTSMRLRGEGKEHIRVYWYQGSATMLSLAASASTPQLPVEVGDGELEEGEVVEHAVAPVKPKRKKKGKKEKHSPVSQLQLAEPVVATNTAPSWSPAPTSVPRQVSAIGGGSSNCAVPASRPTLEERFSDAPAAQDGVWEEEMDLGSEDDYWPERSPSPALVATTIEPSPGVMDVEDWEDDMDMDMSSPVRDVEPGMPAWASRGDTFAEPPQRTLKRPRSPSLDVVAPPRPGPGPASVEARRLELEVAMRENRTGPIASSSNSTVESSSGISTTPEPATPSDWSVDIGMAAGTAAPSVAQIDGREVMALSSPVKDGKPAFDLDQLAESFIAESIQAVNVSVAPSNPRSPSPPAVVRSPARPICPPPLPCTSLVEPPTLSSRSTTSTRQPPTMPSVRPGPSMSKVTAPSATSSSEATQLLAKKNRLEQFIATSRSLLAKIKAAKTQEEKNSLMRILKEKQRAMDAELPGVAASPPTPVARVATVTPTSTSKAKLFRWPDTPREVIIEVTDDEADGAV